MSAVGNALEILRDIERFEWLASFKCCDLSISHNDHHASYLTAAQAIAMPMNADDFHGVSAEELDVMVRTDEIWILYVYPDNPNGSYRFVGASLRSVVDKAMKHFSPNTATS